MDLFWKTYVSKTPNFFLSAAKRAVARYCFYSVMGATAPLLNLTNSGSDAINKVAVDHLWPYAWKKNS